MQTALHISAECGFVSNVRLLLKYGAALVARDRAGLTPLDIAERGEHADCIAVLQQAASEFFSKSLNMYLFEFKFMYHFLSDERENNRQHLHSALREACLAKDVKLAREILSEAGDDAEMIVNLAPNGSNTLLFLYVV